ncbi:MULTISPECIES: FAD-binding oxidoreductase [unclassified Roseovarius]|uniref:NAD(P)/FAD-dependent oxidoreductase n=1 Tax=unclassified Roseovarius TaxID=2614913 RepID=UPI00273D65A4|nr:MULTISPECIES: FAD-dependent oxidoreductase [unclassified Roseovarius]
MADVTIYGAGIFGLSIAWCCQSRGASVRVIDPHGPGAGASGGIVGALAPHVPENWNEKKAFQLESLLSAEGFWRGVQEVSGISAGYARLGRLQPVPDEAALALANARAKTAVALWQANAIWEVVEAADFDWAPITPTGKLIHDTLSARVHPRRACAALAGAITTRGGEIVADGDAEGRVIHATGVAGLQELTASRTRTVGNGVKGQGALLHFDARDMPQLFADTVHIVPHEDGTVAIGSTSEREYDDPRSTDAQLDAVIERAMQAVPVLHGARIVERWAGVRPRTRSRAPMLGAHPLHPGQFIANGGFKIGFGMAPKVGQVMADLVLEGRDTIPCDFRPEASF